ncbi:MAG: protein kinase domain-containing protein [Polyangiaceae bacterium]
MSGRRASARGAVAQPAPRSSRHAAIDPDTTADDGIPVIEASDATPLDDTSAWQAPHRTSAVSAHGNLVAGRYLLGPVLGAGGMGTVYQAEHTDLGKRVAIKVLAATLDGDAEATARFLREAKAASTIDSEHIAQVFDVGEDVHLGLYMVMELLKGEDLSRVLAARGTLRADVAAGVAWQACLALERAHAAGVVHRDLKPANVFLTRGDDGSVRVKILDFGIAKLVHEARSRSLGITQSGIVVGTPHYMSPEQAQGLASVDHRTDLYSLGALLFESMAGSSPYPELETYEQTLYKILCEDPPRLASVVPGVAPALDDLVAELMAREPERRPASAKEVRRRLAAIFPALGRRTLVLGGSAPSVPVPVPTPPVPRTGSGVTVDPLPRALVVPARGRSTALLVIAGTVAIAALVLLFLVARGSRSPEDTVSRVAHDAVAQTAGESRTEETVPAPPPTGIAILAAAEEETAAIVRSAQRALETGDAQKARDLAASATRRAPANGEAWLTLGAADEALGDAAGARVAYQACKEQAPGDRGRECAALLDR